MEPPARALAAPALQIGVHGLSGSICTLAADPKWTLRDVKRAVEACAGIPWCAQRLLHGTTEVRDSAQVGSLLLAGSALDLTLLRRSAEQVIWLDKIKDSWTTIVEAPVRIRADREVIFAAVQQRGSVLRYASQDLRGNRGVVLAAVASAGEALAYASEALCADHEVVLAAVLQNGAALRYAAPDLRSDRRLVLAAVARHGPALKVASKELLADRAFGLCVVTLDGCCLRYLDEELRADREVVLAAARQSKKALLYASEELREDEGILRELGFL